jgi:hypothetical protein
LFKFKRLPAGQDVVDLKVELAEVKTTLKERDKQLGEWKIIADGLIKNNASFDEFKQNMRMFSAQVSIDPSPSSTPDLNYDEDMDNEEKFKGLFDKGE